MKSDKELMREGKYFEALGRNYSRKPYYLIDYSNPVEPQKLGEYFPTPKCHSDFYSSIEEVKDQAKQLGVTEL